VSSRPYLLDTTVLIDVSKRREPASLWLAEMLQGSEQLCVSAVTVAEFFTGLWPAERDDWQVFLSELTHWDVTREIAILGGILRHDLAQQGRTLQIPDALIAATAIVHEATLITANIRDFSGTGVAVMTLELPR
jgi:predicted nucleic acid-binding protein